MKRIFVIALAIATATTAWAQGTGPGAPGKNKGVQMREKIKRAGTQLLEFGRTGGVEHLERAVDTLEEVDLLSIKETRERIEVRRELVVGWCRALRAIDGIKDPKFNPDDSPQMNVTPPFENGAPIHPSGADPKAIKDPHARAEYEAARAANDKKIAQRRVQWKVKELDDRAIETARRVIERFYTTSAADQKDLEAAFTEAKLPAARRTQLMEKHAQ
jgi:hypothetical protein